MFLDFERLEEIFSPSNLSIASSTFALASKSKFGESAEKYKHIRALNNDARPKIQILPRNFKNSV